MARTTGDPRLMADLLGRRAVFKGEAGDLDAAFADNQESLAQSRAAGDNYRIALTLANLGVYEVSAGELQAARAHLQEACTLADDRGYLNMSVGLWQNLGSSSSSTPIARCPPPLPRQPGQGQDHRCQDFLFSRCVPGPGAGGRRGWRPRRRRHYARPRRSLRAGRTGRRGHRRSGCATVTTPELRDHAWWCSVRGRLPRGRSLSHADAVAHGRRHSRGARSRGLSPP